MGLSMAILFAFSLYQAKYAPHHPAAGAPDGGSAAAAQISNPAAAPAPGPAPASPAAGTAAPIAPVPAAPEETWVLETPEMKATFTTLGGALKHIELRGEKFKQEVDNVEVPVDLVKRAPGSAWPSALVASKELGGTGSLSSDPAAQGSMRLVKENSDEHSVTFEGMVGTAQVTKRYALGQRPYELTLDLQASAPTQGDLFLLYPGYVRPDAPKPTCALLASGAPQEIVTPLCHAGGKTERFAGKSPRQEVPGKAAWMGLDEHYFLAAVIPAQEEGPCVFFKGQENGEQGVALRLPVDGKLSASFTLFAGPKQKDLLRSEGRELDKAIDLGTVANLFEPFSRLLLWVMQKLQVIVGSWGLAIILLTVLVKALLYPLTAKSMASMNEMRKLQPEVEKIKQKFGDDKEKLNLAVMQLYQQHKVNPLGGCLPMLIQMPIWFALYATLQTSVELYHAPFLWLTDLTHYDPYFVLPLAMGVSSFLMQKLSPQPADNAQAKMLLYFMPIFFTFIMMKLPSGLTLYILVNNLLSIAQQQWLMRRHPRPVAKAA
jgi:YidC/Oxa1 family membrane protein insertase